MRHSDGGGVSQSKSPGRISEEFVCEILQEQCCEEFGVEKATCEWRIPRRQVAETQKALHPFECEFYLPAEAIDVQHILGVDDATRRAVAAGILSLAEALTRTAKSRASASGNPRSA